MFLNNVLLFPLPEVFALDSVTIAVIKHHDQRQAGKETVLFDLCFHIVAPH